MVMVYLRLNYSLPFLILIYIWIATYCAAFQFDASKTPKAWKIPQNIKFSSLDKLAFLPDNIFYNQQNEVDKVIIATKSIGLNFADIFTVLGLYSAANEVRGKDLTDFVPGLEFSGVVLHDPTGTYKEGDNVLGFTRFGAYSDIVQVSPFYLKRLPNQWTFAQGASFIVQALTAWHGLVEIGRMPNIQPSNANKPYVVIVHSAAGGVGLWASEIAARRGAVVIGIVGSESKAEIFYKRIQHFSPYSQAMIRGDERDFEKRLVQKLQTVYSSVLHDFDFHPYDNDLKEMAKDGYGAHIVMESLGGQYFQVCFKSLNNGGALVTFGSTSYVTPGLGINMLRLIYRYITRPRVDPGALTSRNLRLCGFNLIFLTEQVKELRRELNECIACLSGMEISKYDDIGEVEVPLDAVIPPVVGGTFDFRTEAVEAMEMLKGGSTVGKVVLNNDQNPFSSQIE